MRGGIGSLFEGDDEGDAVPASTATFGISAGPTDTDDAPAMHLGRIVSTIFITMDPHDFISRGPFPIARAWISARLDLAEADCEQRLEVAREQEVAEAAVQSFDRGHDGNYHDVNGDDGDNEGLSEEDDGDDSDDYDDDDDDCMEDPENLEYSLLVITKLKAQLDNFFPLDGPTPEPTIIVHDELNRHNILVDEKGALAAVVDWEGISAIPLFMACHYPSFIQSDELDEEPDRSKFHDEPYYWEKMEEYELAQLRKVFRAEMQRLEPAWVEVMQSEESERKLDFDTVLTKCFNPLSTAGLMAWLDDLESGDAGMMSLEQRLADI
ncbi:hypothetical protein CDD83_10701 [Cordyceps sp. RAO-2017]|nr:hypothetical protein CDD83_10701 [Cordyceps sp. RAO-2017]